jgi:hypothetical protein
MPRTPASHYAFCLQKTMEARRNYKRRYAEALGHLRGQTSSIVPIIVSDRRRVLAQVRELEATCFDSSYC